MSVPTIAFFNNKGGVGKTSLVYHLAWMYAELGIRVLAADLDPQANLTAMFLDDDALAELWPEGEHPLTIAGGVSEIRRGIGDVKAPPLRPIDDAERLALVPGDLALSQFEDSLSEVWPKAADGDERAFRVLSAFWRIMQDNAAAHNAGLVLIDLGPNVGAINRAALISADFIVVPLSPDLFSLQGLRNLGPSLRMWRQQWAERKGKNPVSSLSLPPGTMKPIGYVVQQHSVRLDRPVQAYDKWVRRIPAAYAEYVLGQGGNEIEGGSDGNRLAMLKNYRSLVPMAQEARKPMFDLKPADGAQGSHLSAAREVGKDFRRLAEAIVEKAGLELALPSPAPS